MLPLIIALMPVIILLVYIYVRDKYEKEPIWLLLLTLFAGMLTVIPVLLVGELLEIIYRSATFLHGEILKVFYDSFIVAALNEEGFKALAFFILIWRSKHFNEKFDGIVYAVFVSLGFAAIENILYVFEFGMGTGALRAFTAVPAHAVFGVTMGYFFGYAKIKKKRVKYNIALGFGLAVLLHGIYNFILMSENEALLLLFIPYVFFIFRSAHIRMKKHSDTSKFRPTDEEI